MTQYHYYNFQNIVTATIKIHYTGKLKLMSYINFQNKNSCKFIFCLEMLCLKQSFIILKMIGHYFK